MSYLHVLEQIEQGQLTVSEAVENLSYQATKREKCAKKIKLEIHHQGKNISFPAIPIAMLGPFFKLCAPFITFDNQDIRLSKKERQRVIYHLERIIKLAKDYPPFEVLVIEDEGTCVKIRTK